MTEMPDTQGKLTQAEIQAVQAWMTKQGTGLHICPVCSSGQWTIGEFIVQPLVVSGGGVPQMGGIGYPNVLLLSPCGYTRYMNAVIMGILPPVRHG